MFNFILYLANLQLGFKNDLKVKPGIKHKTYKVDISVLSQVETYVSPFRIGLFDHACLSMIFFIM